MSAAPRPSLVKSTPTRALLIAAAFAAVQAILFLSILPLLSAAASSIPPVYALLAGLNTIAPFLARTITRTPGTATITAGITAALVVAASPLGLLSAIPLLTAGAVFDVIAWKGTVSIRRLLVGAGAVAIALFLISLPVFSPEHLTPGVLAATFAARLAGEAASALLVIAITRNLRRAGVGR